MRRYLTATTLGLLALVIFAMPALAGRTWCARDPIVRLNGEDIQIWVAIPEEYQTLVTGPVDLRINTPTGVTTAVRYLDSGFNGYGEKVTFGALANGKQYADGSFDVQLTVKVPINTKKVKKIPLQLTVRIGGSAHEIAPGTWEYTGGTTHVIEMTNDGTTLAARFPKPAS